MSARVHCRGCKAQVPAVLIRCPECETPTKGPLYTADWEEVAVEAGAWALLLSLGAGSLIWALA